MRTGESFKRLTRGTSSLPVIFLEAASGEGMTVQSRLKRRNRFEPAAVARPDDSGCEARFDRGAGTGAEPGGE